MAPAATRAALQGILADAERDYAYQSVAATLDAVEPFTATASRAGWTVVSMARNWDRASSKSGS